MRFVPNSNSLDRCPAANNVFAVKKTERGYVFSFWEVVIAFWIVATVFGTIIGGYLLGATKAQWSGYSLAAQSLSIQALEQARSARLDFTLTNGMEVTNMTLINKAVTSAAQPGCWIMTGYTTNVLDVPWKGTNYVLATNFITIKTFFQNGNTNPWVQMEMIRVDTVWPFSGWNHFSTGNYTNTIVSYAAPDNRAPSSLGL